LAQIRSLNHGSQNVRRHKTFVDGFYQVVSASGGERLVHLSTFGSDDRKAEPKSSQSIQFSEESARDLVRVFAQTWGWSGGE
jgi:5-methylcytosine-specific restriction protein B